MAVVLAWLRLDLPRRWRSLAVLALLTAIASGTVMTALAASRRGASALERLSAQTLPATSAILANQTPFDWGPIRALPEVESLTTFAVDYGWSVEGVKPDALGFPPTDDAVMRTIEKPVVFKGRVFDATRADEVVVTRGFVKSYHKSVGDTAVVHLATPMELIDEAGTGPDGSFTGPKFTVRIVGVVESPWFTDSPGGNGGFVLSPAVVATYPANTVGDQRDPENHQFVNALVRLKGGEAAIPLLRKDVERITGRHDIDIWNLPDQLRSAQHQIAFESRCLVAFAVAAFVAALFLVGQAIVRYAAVSTAELQTLRALGMSPRQAVGTAMAGPAIVGVIGAVLGGVGAIIASRWFPFGTADLLEPSPGTSVDWVVLGPGLVAVVVLVAGGAAAAAALALSAARRSATARRSTLAAAVGRGGFPVPVVVGTRFALEAGRGRTAVPVRPALIGAVTGVLGILAAFTFSHGVTDAAAHPERFGQTYQYASFVGINGHDFGSADKLAKALTANSDVDGFDDARTAVATGTDENSSVSLWTYAAGTKPVPVVVTSGRMPESDGEVLLAPQSVKAMHARVGEKIMFSGSRGKSVPFTVTGIGFVPAGPHNGYADGGWITNAGYDRVFKDFKFHIVLVTLRPDARTADAGTKLAAAITKSDPDLQGTTFDPPDPIIEVAELRQIRVLPIFLGVFLALLAIGAVGHALGTAVRRRSHDIAVLRALGMTQWQCRWVVVTQASVLAVIGLIFGVPLGLAIGRTVWRLVADYTPLQYVAPMALWALLLIGPAALLIANVLAAWPGRRAARLRIAHILRTE